MPLVALSRSSIREVSGDKAKAEVTRSGIQEAIDKLGGQVLFVEALKKRGVERSQQAVSYWVTKGFCPVLDLVPLIAELSGVDPRRLCDPRILQVIDPQA